MFGGLNFQHSTRITCHISKIKFHESNCGSLGGVWWDERVIWRRCIIKIGWEIWGGVSPIRRLMVSTLHSIAPYNGCAWIGCFLLLGSPIAKRYKSKQASGRTDNDIAVGGKRTEKGLAAASTYYYEATPSCSIRIQLRRTKKLSFPLHPKKKKEKEKKTIYMI